jgi:prophage regulatory protein
MTIPRPRLVGAHEIRDRLGNVSRQRVYQLTNRPGFPKPIADLKNGKVWLADEAEAWIAANRSVLTEKPSP